MSGHQTRLEGNHLMSSFRKGLPLAVGAVLLLSACGGAAAPSSAPASSPAAKPAVSSPAASPSANAAASAGTAGAKPAASAAAAASGTIRVGLLEPLTGPQSNVGIDNQDGFNLYLNSVNSTMAGRKIEAIYADDRFQADVGLTKAKELVESQGAKVLMGITPTPEGYAIAPYVRDQKVPTLITGNAGGLGMTTDPKYKSPYLVRFTQTGTEINDPAADWAVKQGYKKAVLISSDFAPGIQNTDYFSSIFVQGGGTVVQEMHPAVGTNDFGPFLAKLDQTADVIYGFLPGVDGLRFLQQYRDYAAGSKAQIIDAFGTIAAGHNLEQEGDKAIGVVGVDIFTSAATYPATQAFLKQWNAAYNGRLFTHDAAMGYAGGQILENALKAVNGNIDDTQAFMDAIYKTSFDSAMGPIRLDDTHDIIRNIYVYRVIKQGNTFGQELVQTYQNVSDTWDRSQQQVDSFPAGQLKDKWVGMTKDKLQQIAGCNPSCTKSQ
jgi:branched-chain amino acid transport system substrate-binding protein